MLALQEEIQRSHESRYDHRLHGVVLVAQSGRSPRLDPAHVAQVRAALRGKPAEVGLTGNLWDGKTLAAYVRQLAVALRPR